MAGCSPEQAASRRYCKMWKKCQKDDFQDRFDSIHECTKLRRLGAKENRYRTKIEVSAECANAERDYEACYSKQLTCDRFIGMDPTDEELESYEDWIEDTQDECSEEIDLVNDECD
jgi:hypothetical protein